LLKFEVEINPEKQLASGIVDVNFNIRNTDLIAVDEMNILIATKKLHLFD
jgi:hypothetical protein